MKDINDKDDDTSFSDILITQGSKDKTKDIITNTFYHQITRIVTN